MKKLLVPFLIVAMVLTGCSLTQKSPKEVVSDAFKNLEGMDYYDYKFTVDGDMTADGEDVGFSIAYSGQQDNTDKTKPKFSMTIDFGFDVEEFGNQFASAEMISDGEYLYFVLNDISDFGGDLPAEMVDPFKGKWYGLSLEDDTLGAMAPFSFQMQDEENMTEEQKQLMELYEDTEFFTDYKFVRTENGYDVYSAVLDKEASKEFIEEAMKLQGQAFSTDEEAGFDDFMESSEMDVLMYIDKAENVLTKATGTVTMTELEGANGTFDFTMEFFNLHQPVVIEAPAEYEEFDPMMIFAAMVGVDPATLESAMTIDAASVDDNSMMMDGSMMDTSMYEDMGMSPEEMEEYTKEMEKALEGLDSLEDLEMEYDGSSSSSTDEYSGGPISPGDMPDLTQ